MRAVAQRVTRAEVRRSDGRQVLGRIGHGLVVLVGIGHGDEESDAVWLVDKLIHLRIFPDLRVRVGPDASPDASPAEEPEGRDDKDAMNRSLLDVGGGLLLVSQFTLYGDCKKGRRPSFTDAMAPGPARSLYERVVALARSTQAPVATGEFGAMMHIELVNDGPVTLCLDSRDRPQRSAPSRPPGRKAAGPVGG